MLRRLPRRSWWRFMYTAVSCMVSCAMRRGFVLVPLALGAREARGGHAPQRYTRRRRTAARRRGACGRGSRVSRVRARLAAPHAGRPHRQGRGDAPQLRPLRVRVRLHGEAHYDERDASGTAVRALRRLNGTACNLCTSVAACPPRATRARARARLRSTVPRGAAADGRGGRARQAVLVPVRRRRYRLSEQLCETQPETSIEMVDGLPGDGDAPVRLALRQFAGAQSKSYCTGRPDQLNYSYRVEGDLDNSPSARQVPAGTRHRRRQPRLREHRLRGRRSRARPQATSTRCAPAFPCAAACRGTRPKWSRSTGSVLASGEALYLSCLEERPRTRATCATLSSRAGTPFSFTCFTGDCVYENATTGPPLPTPRRASRSRASARGPRARARARRDARRILRLRALPS